MTDLVLAGPQAFSFEGHAVRVVARDGAPWWVVNDACVALEIADAATARQRLDPEDLALAPILANDGKTYDTAIVNESGLYELIFRSDKPAAKRFRRWVTSVVLPSIRKTGGYGRELTRMELLQMAMDAEKERLAIAAQLDEATERVDELSDHIAAIAPEAGAWRSLAAAGDDWLVEDVARILNRDPAIQTGGGRLWKKLYEWDAITRYRERPQPRQKYIDQGLFRVRIVTYPDPAGSGLTPKSSPQVRVTYKGIVWIHRRLGGTALVDDLFGED